MASKGCGEIPSMDAAWMMGDVEKGGEEGYTVVVVVTMAGAVRQT